MHRPRPARATGLCGSRAFGKHEDARRCGGKTAAAGGAKGIRPVAVRASFPRTSIAAKTGDGGTAARMFNRRVPMTDFRMAAHGRAPRSVSAAPDAK
jgi:hypothetical protein